MKRPRRRTGNRNRVITLANMVEVCRGEPSDGSQGCGPADKGETIDRSFHGSRPAQESSMPSWADAATRCLNAYIKRDYSACVAAGREALSHQLIPTIGLVTILALRRWGRSEEAEVLGRALLRSGTGRGVSFLLLMMLLDGALDPEQFLKERIFGGYRVEVSRELECQVYFYWGAKLLTEGKFSGAIRPLLICVGMECSALERSLANADLASAHSLPGKHN
jgi:hypothetical protein